MIQNCQKVLLYMLLLVTGAFTTLLVLKLGPITLTTWKQLYPLYFATKCVELISQTLIQFKSLLILWILTLPVFCLHKIFAKRYFAFSKKSIVLEKLPLYKNTQFKSLPATDHMPSHFIYSTEVHHQKKKDCHKRPARTALRANKENNNMDNEPIPDTIANKEIEEAASGIFIDSKKGSEEEWITVTVGNRKKRHNKGTTTPTLPPILPTDNQCKNNNTTPKTSTRKTKSNCRKSSKKHHKHNVENNERDSNYQETLKSANPDEALAFSSSADDKPSSWTNPGERQAAITDTEDDEVPSLSDNESSSTDGSIRSPCLSHSDQLYQQHQDKKVLVLGAGNSYSPFSSGFDFSAFLETSQQQAQSLMITQQYPTMYKHSEDRDIFSQYQQNHPYCTTNEEKYTLSNGRAQRESILTLLKPRNQIPTSITPSYFKHFDDMMMSASLYHIKEEKFVNSN